MGGFLTIWAAVLPVFCVGGIGAALRWRGLLTEEADASLLRLTVNLLIPCLIIDSIIGNPALAQWRNLILAPAIGFGTVGLGLGAGWLVARLAVDGQDARRTFAFVVAVYNYGYVPLPLAQAMFDRETVGVLFVHNVGVEAALWSVALLTLTGGRAGRGWRNVINPPLVAILVGLTLNLPGHGLQLPAFLRTTAHWLGQCAIPLALLLIGATIADFSHEFRIQRGARVISCASLLRLGVLPVCFLLLAKWLPVSVELRRVMVLEAAMPAAVFPLVITRHYGGEMTVALRVVIGTTLLGLVTIPIWVRLGMQFAGLQ